jgi:ectoine hydroxylase-related dioxygenase (phytanoyl-CoA dioxygenase family)
MKNIKNNFNLKKQTKCFPFILGYNILKTLRRRIAARGSISQKEYGVPKSIKSQLDQHYPVTQKNIYYFHENGFIKLKNVLSPELLVHYGTEITRKVFELNTMHLPMEKRDTYHKAFLQIANLWTKSELVKEFVMGKGLAQIAADLMGTRGVRLYHDQALYKEKGGGLTPWHADQYYWPLASEKCCTAWIPLQMTPLEMGPVSFSAKSHHFSAGRKLAISDESELELREALKKANFKYIAEPFELGEVSFHYGWTFHNAGPNTTDRPREVMTIIYMDEHMRLKNPDNENQRIDWEVWCPGVKVGDIISTELNPVIYSS